MRYKYVQRLGVKNLIEVYKKDLLARYISEHCKTNCFVCKFAIYPMTDIQFLETAHYFMKDNGVYFYNGSQIDFDKLE